MAGNFASCSEENLDVYDQVSSGASIYFLDKYKQADDLYQSIPKDTLWTSFGYVGETTQDSVVKQVVRISGEKMDHDRTYKLTVLSSSTAVEGVHYEFLNESFVIKANAVTDTIKIKFNRTEDMKDSTFRISLRLEPNDNFNTDIPVMKSKAENGKYTYELTHMEFKVDDITGVPFLWTDPPYNSFTPSYLGTFSRTKLLLMIEVMNIDPNLITVPPPAGQYFNLDYYFAWNAYMTTWLESEAAKGNYYYDEFGELIKFHL